MPKYKMLGRLMGNRIAYFWSVQEGVKMSSPFHPLAQSEKLYLRDLADWVSFGPEPSNPMKNYYDLTVVQ